MIHIDEEKDIFEITGPKVKVLAELTSSVMMISEDENIDAEKLLVDIGASIKFANLVKAGMDKDEALTILGYKEP